MLFFFYLNIKIKSLSFLLKIQLHIDNYNYTFCAYITEPYLSSIKYKQQCNDLMYQIKMSCISYHNSFLTGFSLVNSELYYQSQHPLRYLGESIKSNFHYIYNFIINATKVILLFYTTKLFNII
jgi:hypothetical protein